MLDKGSRARRSYMKAFKSAAFLEHATNVWSLVTLALVSACLFAFVFGGGLWLRWVCIGVAVAYIVLWVAFFVAKRARARLLLKLHLITSDRRYLEACAAERKLLLDYVEKAVKAYEEACGRMTVCQPPAKDGTIKDKAFTGKVDDGKIAEDGYDRYD